MALLPANRCMKSPRCELVPSRRIGDELGFEILLEAGDAHLAADAGLLVAAERCVRRVPDAAVDPERAGADTGHDAFDPPGVAAPDRTREPVGRVVGDPHRILVAVV